VTASELLAIASHLAKPFHPSEDCTAGEVAAALVTTSGNVYTGVCVDSECSVGFCAEHAAVAEMLKAHESEIDLIVAVDCNGAVGAPCGRCRELIWQVSPHNARTRVMVGPTEMMTLAELLPLRGNQEERE